MTGYRSLVYGIYPRSEGLRKNINLWERSKLSRDELKQKVQDEKKKISVLMDSPGMLYTDPLSNWHDILRPLAMSLGSVRLGELRRYKETNTFYRQPVIDDYPKYAEPEDQDGFPYFPAFADSLQGSPYAFLPGPHSFLQMSSSSDSLDRKKILQALSDSFRTFLEVRHAEKVVIFDPVEYGTADLGYLSGIAEEFSTILVASGTLNSSNLGSISKRLSGISAGGGLEALRDFPGDVYLQEVNSQNTRLENAQELLTLLDRKKRNLKINVAGVTHTEYFDFLPRSIADRKVELLREVASHD